MHSPVLYVFLVGVGLCCTSCQTTRNSNENDEARSGEQFAEAFGWVTNYTRGQEIIREISALSPEQARQLKFDAYRGENVAFMTGDALPGIGDRVTDRGFYLRVIYQKGKNPGPRPYVWSTSMVRGKILQVLPANKIIVIEVNEEHVVSSG
jgi:hypothetical protein